MKWRMLILAGLVGLSGLVRAETESGDDTGDTIVLPDPPACTECNKNFTNRQGLTYATDSFAKRETHVQQRINELLGGSVEGGETTKKTQ